MNHRQIRWLILALRSAVLVGVLARRRMALVQQLPAFVEERIVLPLGDRVRETVTPEISDAMAGGVTRKVGRNRKISVGGKLYGPLEADLVGEQVDVEEREGRIVVFAGQNEVGNFERQ